MKIKQLLESATAGGTSTASVATVAKGSKTMLKRQKPTDNALDKGKLFQEADIEESDPCWKNYKQIGMKKKGSKSVPNCVPKESIDQGVAEGLGKDIKRLATGKDVKSRAGQEIAKSQDASMRGDHKTSKKHFDRYDKLDKLANKEQGVAEGLPQTLRKVVPGYAKREIDKKMDDQKFGRTDVDKDANYYRYKKIQDKLKEQGVAEAYDHNAPFNAADFNRHMDRLRAREELRKTDPMKALVGDMIDKDREKETLAKRKKPEDDSMSTSDPRHPQYSYTQAGQQGVAEGAPIVVMPSPERLKKAEPKKVDLSKIGTPAKPPSTEKRGVKGRPGQRPMPQYEQGVAEGEVEENKKGVRAVKHAVKPRNFVAKNAVQSGAGAHKDKKKAQKQGDVKHKSKEPAYESRLWAALDQRIIK